MLQVDGHSGHSVKSCSLAYSCHKCKGNHNITICTYSRDQDSPNTAPATILSNNEYNILLQSGIAADSNFKSPGNLINVQVFFESGNQRSYVSGKLKAIIKVAKNPFRKHCSK